jgi:hypothetical protein
MCAVAITEVAHPSFALSLESVYVHVLLFPTYYVEFERGMLYAHADYAEGGGIFLRHSVSIRNIIYVHCSCHC